MTKKTLSEKIYLTFAIIGVVIMLSGLIIQFYPTINFTPFNSSTIIGIGLCVGVIGMIKDMFD